MGNPNRLTTREVARICRVSDATVKRWAAAGLIDSEKTTGGHRRFLADSVAKFQTEYQLGIGCGKPDSSIALANERQRLRKELGGSKLLRSLLCGCVEEVSNQLVSRLLDGWRIEKILDEALCVEMCQIGRLWSSGKISVAEEHLASITASQALFRVSDSIPSSEVKDKIAICCSIEGDHHALPSGFARLVFESRGWRAVDFGANMPLYSMTSELKRCSPDVLCLSGTVVDELERLTKDFRELTGILKRQNTKVVIGGRAFGDPDLRERFPADHYADSFTNLANYVDSLT